MEAFGGHRGFSHSILFSLLWAVLVSGCFWFLVKTYKKRDYLFITALVFLSTISHGLLDALTNGGLGVALFSPFDTGRVFFSNTPYISFSHWFQVFWTTRLDGIGK